MAENNKFDLQRLCNSLSSVKDEEGNILMEPYIEAYGELVHFFRMFGSIFGFVNCDIKEKIQILKDHLASEHGSHYSTVQGMVKFEVENNIFKQKTKLPNGCRTYLRLHRALEFMTDFIHRLRNTSNDDKMSVVVWDAYKGTLKKFHPWVIQKGVSLATCMVPNRQHLLVNMGTESEEKTLELMDKTTGYSQDIYNVVQQLYSEYKLHDLP